MKLIYCQTCNDIVRLTFDKKFCDCKKCFGYYEPDGLHAVISEYSIPLGIQNVSLYFSLANQPESGLGKRFEAFVIPKQCDTIKVIK